MPPTLPDAELEERAAISFLGELVADLAAGIRRDLADYLRRHPTFQPRIAEEWLRATGRTAAAPAGPAGTPAERTGHIGPYVPLRELGRGGQGVVYLADDPRLGRQVALKVLHTGLAALDGPARLRLQREADAVAKLDHPGIATIYATGEDAHAAWIAMRYVPGGSVQQAVATRLAAGLGPPTGAGLETTVRLAARAARALDAAHRAGIVHRDVKPGNLLLQAPDEPVLVDFGLATDAAGRTPAVTLPGALPGTLCYLPPERLAGGPADARGDVYALGAVLFELLTLRRPHHAATTAAELHAIGAGAAPDVRRANPAVSRDLAVVVATALAPAPAARYQSAAAFADDLECVLSHRPIAARPPGPLGRLWRWAKRSPALAASLAALGLALVGGLLATTWQWQRSEAALADVRRLADLERARNLRDRADSLWPARPERIPAMSAFRAEFAALRERTDKHREHLAGLLPAGVDATADWQRKQLDELLGLLGTLAGIDASVEQRIAAAAALPARTLEEPASAWAAAAARVAADPRFPGLSLRPQLGLVPLGPDPDSGLEEFAHVLSGDVPRRGADGRLSSAPGDGIVLVLVPGGEVVLGAEPKPPADGHPSHLDPSADATLGPCYSLRLAPFLFGKFEVTQEQWQRHTGRNPSTYHPKNELATEIGPRHPVETVAWLDADAVLRQLDLQLPTEAQWERAYRAGTASRFPSGDDEHTLAGRENLADRTAREKGGNQRLRFVDWLDDGWLAHAPVGTFRANPFGLHDLGGNVKEWCADSWENYDACAPRAGDGLRRGAYERYRVIRGGSFASCVDEARSASRTGSQKDAAGAECGLRAARALEP